KTSLKIYAGDSVHSPSPVKSLCCFNGIKSIEISYRRLLQEDAAFMLIFSEMTQIQTSDICQKYNALPVF
ncbi:MAG TPA: hypothetical protein H9852_05400, partial [Candidatus Mediterraneibacter colneyensis]|nr:hypothetical protein [Candidatus Mediterraneibacter colneyensis]